MLSPVVAPIKLTERRRRKNEIGIGRMGRKEIDRAFNRPWQARVRPDPAGILRS